MLMPETLKKLKMLNQRSLLPVEPTSGQKRKQNKEVTQEGKTPTQTQDNNGITGNAAWAMVAKWLRSCWVVNKTCQLTYPDGVNT